jgi:hypothetical protein
VVDDSHVVFDQTSPAEKENVRQCIVTKVWDNVFSHFHAVAIKCKEYTELTVWPARKSSLASVPLMSKKIMSMLLTLRL